MGGTTVIEVSDSASTSVTNQATTDVLIETDGATDVSLSISVSGQIEVSQEGGIVRTTIVQQGVPGASGSGSGNSGFPSGW